MKSKYVILIGLSIVLIFSVTIFSCSASRSLNGYDFMLPEWGIILVGVTNETGEERTDECKIAFSDPIYSAYGQYPSERTYLSEEVIYFVVPPGIYKWNHLIIKDSPARKKMFSDIDIYEQLGASHPDTGFVVLANTITYVGSIRLSKSASGEISYNLHSDVEAARGSFSPDSKLNGVPVLDQSSTESYSQFRDQIEFIRNSDYSYPALDYMGAKYYPPFSGKAALAIGMDQGPFEEGYVLAGSITLSSQYVEKAFKEGHWRESNEYNISVKPGEVRYISLTPGIYTVHQVNLHIFNDNVKTFNINREFLLLPNKITYGGRITQAGYTWTLSDDGQESKRYIGRLLDIPATDGLGISNQSTPKRRRVVLARIEAIKEEANSKEGGSNNIAKIVGVAAGVALVGMTDLSAADKLNVGLDVATTIVTGESTNSSSSSGDGSLTSGVNEKGQFAIEPSSGSSGSSFDAKPIQTSKPKQQTTKMIVAVAREKTRCNYTDLGIVWKRGSGTMAELKSIASKTAARQYPDYDKIEFKDSVEWGENCNYLVIISGTTKNSDNCERFTFGVGFGQNRSIAVDNALVYLNGMNWDWNEARDGFEVVHEEAF